MKTTKALTSGLVMMLTAILGCGRGDAHDGLSGADPRAQATLQAGGTTSHSYAFGASGVKATSRVERRLAANGAEVLRGTTEVTFADAAHPTVLVEEAHLDAAGRLVRATSELHAGPGALTRVRSVELDAARGAVTVRDERGARSWPVAADHPWMYAGLFDDVAPQAAGVTAVQAWVARRAAQAGDRVRMVDVLAHRSNVTVPEQIVFSDGDKDLVVVGDEVAETDHNFVRSLPWKTLEAVSDELCAAPAASSPRPASGG